MGLAAQTRRLEQRRLVCLNAIVSQLPDGVFKSWIHSREEDSSGIRVYRPKGYRFPPSRGRSGFEIRPDGRFVRIDIGPADGTRGVPGRWHAEPGQRVRIQYDDGREEVMTLVSLGEDLLKVQTDT